jgi:hypothetical protein
MSFFFGFGFWLFLPPPLPPSRSSLFFFGAAQRARTTGTKKILARFSSHGA